VSCVFQNRAKKTPPLLTVRPGKHRAQGGHLLLLVASLVFGCRNFLLNHIQRVVVYMKRLAVARASLDARGRNRTASLQQRGGFAQSTANHESAMRSTPTASSVVRLLARLLAHRATVSASQPLVFEKEKTRVYSCGTSQRLGAGRAVDGALAHHDLSLERIAASDKKDETTNKSVNLYNSPLGAGEAVLVPLLLQRADTHTVNRLKENKK
jgi:hypothetical protein